MYTWNLGNEPILIENVEYQSIQSFIQSVFHELKMILENVRRYDSYVANSFKTILMESLHGNTVLHEFISEL